MLISKKIKKIQKKPKKRLTKWKKCGKVIKPSQDGTDFEN